MSRWKQQTAEERFWQHVERRGPDECWEWTGSLQEKGYGQFNAGRDENGRVVTVRAHRFAYELKYGPTDKKVLHSCDNRKCVNNEKHLFAGTQADNMRDMRQKERGFSILTEWKVSLIKRFLSNARTHKSIAEDFHVSKATIDHIATGRLWDDVEIWRCSERRLTPEMWRQIVGGVKSELKQIQL